MTIELKKINRRRFRQCAAPVLEDFEPGMVVEHRPGRTIGESDNAWYSPITMNTHPLHYDKVHAEQTEFGVPLPDSPMTFSILKGTAVRLTGEDDYSGDCRYGRTTLPRPVVTGDTIYAETEIKSAEVHPTDPGKSLIEAEIRGLNQRKEIIATMEFHFSAPKSGHQVKIDDRYE